MWPRFGHFCHSVLHEKVICGGNKININTVKRIKSHPFTFDPQLRYFLLRKSAFNSASLITPFHLSPNPDMHVKTEFSSALNSDIQPSFLQWSGR